MTFWLDAQLPPSLAAWLGSHFKIIVKPLREIGLRDAEDPELLAAAERFGNIVILTKDSGFVDLARQAASSTQMVWLRCGNLSNRELEQWLTTRFQRALDAIMLGDRVVELAD